MRGTADAWIVIDRVTDASLSPVPISHRGLTMSSFEVREGEQFRPKEQVRLIRTPRSNATFAQPETRIQPGVGCMNVILSN